MKRLFRKTTLIAVALLAGATAVSCSTLRAGLILSGGQADGQLSHAIPVPFKRYGHAMVVEVQLNRGARKYAFLLDTGSATVVLDTRTAEELKLPVLSTLNVQDTAGEIRALAMSRLSHLDMGGAGVSNVGAVVIDLTPIRRNSTGVRIDGIVGANFLRRFRLLIDYQSATITFLPAGQTPAQLDMDTAIHLPLSSSIFRGYCPFVPCTINGKNHQCEIDTGAPAPLMVPMDLASKSPDKRIRADGPALGGAFATTETAILTRLDSLRLGGDDSPGVVAENQAVVALSTFKAIALGESFLREFRILIDFPASLVQLFPAGAGSTDIVGSGIRVGFDDRDVLRVMSVLHTSPAYGVLKPGYEIVQVNTLSATPENLAPIIDVMRGNAGGEAVVQFREAASTAERAPVRTTRIRMTNLVPR